MSEEIDINKYTKEAMHDFDLKDESLVRSFIKMVYIAGKLEGHDRATAVCLKSLREQGL